MKKIFIIAIAVLSLLSAPLTSFAEEKNATNPGFLRRIENRLLQVTKTQERENAQEDRSENRENRNNNLKGKNLHIVDGVVTNISGGTLTVTKDGKTYTVLTDSSTKCRRHFWGTCNISEIQINDHVNVWGKLAANVTPPTDTTIQATMVRDLSIMKRYGVFFGDVTGKTTASFTMKTIGRGTQTVTFDSTTKWINRKQQTITFADVQVGDRVRVRGLWDKTNSTITQVKEVKDFSLPAQPKVSTTPEVTSAPTVTPTTGPSDTPAPTVTEGPTITPTPTP